jgi:hypothetical protein
MTKIRAQTGLEAVGRMFMKEIRLTLSADDFGAISQVLVDMGVSFRVEPLEGATEATATRGSPSPTPSRGRTSRKARKAGPKQVSKRDEVPLSAADRLRKALAQKQATGGSASSIPTGQPTADAPQSYRSAPPDEGSA